MNIGIEIYVHIVDIPEVIISTLVTFREKVLDGPLYSERPKGASCKFRYGW